MWLLFLNSLKGIKKKRLQMIGLTFLILISTAVYTTMNSALDRMDSMSEQYMEEQNVEHMTILLNETNILTRENIADMFNEKLSSWKDIELPEVVVTDEMLEKYDQEGLQEMRDSIIESGVPEFMVETILKQQIGKILAGSNYLLGIINGTYPADDLNTYIFYGCSSKAKNESTNLDPNLPYLKFCPINPGTTTSSDNPSEVPTTDDECADDSSTNTNASSNIAKLYENFSAMTNNNSYGVDKYEYLTPIMEELSQAYDFTYVLKANKVLTYSVTGDDQNYAASIMVYDANLKVNTPYLIEGQEPVNNDEITIALPFAKSNEIELNSYFEIDGKEYKVVGFAYAPDYIYPAISFNTPLYDVKRHTVIYTNQATYDDFNGKEEKYYAAKFNDYNGSYTDEALQDLVKPVRKDSRVLYVLSTATISPRISMFTEEVKNNRVFTSYFMYVLLTIAIFIIIMVMKKRIDDERLQIGVLKSLGYNTYMIAAGYLVYPIVGSIIGGILGYGLGVILQGPVVNLYKSFYNIPMNDFFFDAKYLLLSLVIPLLSLSLLSYLVALFMLRHRPLKLLREGSNLKVNFMTKIVTKLTSPLKFKSRFRLSLASRSLGKLLVITLCSFCTGLLIVLTLIGSTMMNKMIDKTFAGASYDYQITYSSMVDPTIIDGYDENHDNEDLIVSSDLTLYQIIRRNGTNEVLDKTRSVTVNGIDENLNLLKITNSDGEDISYKLFEDNGQEGVDNIVINDTIRTLLKVEIGDTLILSKRVDIDGNVQCSNDKKYLIVDINETFSGLNSYVDKGSIAEYLGYSDQSYNMIYTDELKSIYDESNTNISSVFRYDDLKKNISIAIEMANYSIYIIIAFAGAMALIIISVVSNIVVDENKKHISLMKVMGYKEKEIKSVVLNIYTPFVLIAYLLSIPAMKGILRFIISLVARDLDFSVPIELSLQGALLGLAVIMAAYFIALSMSRKALNRVSLAEALKRE